MHLPIIELMFANTGNPPNNPPNNPEATTPSLADIVREETEDGRLIVRFLIDVMQGLLEQSKPCHRLDAARQLLTLGFHTAQSFIDANTPASSPQKKLRALRVLGVETTPLHRELAALIREETDNGRTTVRFLVDVMQGKIPDFKPHHRLSAAKELLRRGFHAPSTPNAVNSTGPESGPESVEESAPAEKRPPAPRSWTHILKGRYACYPAGYSRYETEYGPFNFDSYDDEDYYFDCDGSYARHYVLGGKEATSAVHKALYEFRYDARQIAKATNQDPNGCDHLIKVPADAPQPENIYGYQALQRKFGSEQAARIAAWAAAQYHRKQAGLAGEDYPALRPGPKDGPALPMASRHLYVSSDRSAEEEYPDDRSQADLGTGPPDSTELPSWVELIKEGRRARAYGDSVEGYSWGTIPPIWPPYTRFPPTCSKRYLASKPVSKANPSTPAGATNTCSKSCLVETRLPWPG